MIPKWLCIPTGLAAAKLQSSLGWRSCIFIALVLLSFVDKIVDRMYYDRKARRLGALPSMQRPFKVPWAIDGVYKSIQADKKGVLLDFFTTSFDDLVGPKIHTFKQTIFGTPQHFTVDPKNIQALLATQFNDFEIGENRKNMFYALLGDGIFTSDGKLWEHSRALLRPQFTRDQISDLNMEEKHVQEVFKHLPILSNGWTGEVDLKPIFFRLTLDSATDILFGQSVQSQLAALPQTSNEKGNYMSYEGLNWDAMITSFDEALRGLGHRMRFNELYWLHSPRHFLDACKEVHKFADFYVNLALHNDLYDLNEKKTGKRPKYIFLAELVKYTRDPIELRSQLLHIMLAGRDTTAGLLGWTFALLARHPHIYDKLRKTIINEFGTYENPHDITFSTLKGCQYMQHVFNETLRLYPPVPLNGRRAVRDTTLPRGGGPDGESPIFVRKGEECVYSVYIMSRRTELWGADAHDFNPDRWLTKRPGWEFLPFNGGPRICLGQNLALTEAAYILVRMMQRYDKIENLDPDSKIPQQMFVTLAPASVKVRLHEA